MKTYKLSSNINFNKNTLNGSLNTISGISSVLYSNVILMNKVIAPFFEGNIITK